MGEILPFFAKVRARGDWSAAERERLAELADRFGGDAEGIDIVFGETDEGEPWCVVKDAEDEVLVHVARIAGRFIVHYSENDGLTEGSDLPALLGQQLHWETEDDVVVPFSRRAQSFLALLVATAFFYELHEHGSEHAGAQDERGHAPEDLLARALGNEAAEGHAAHEHMLAMPGHWNVGEHVSFQHFVDPDAWSDGVDRSGLQEAAHPQPEAESARAATLQPVAFTANPDHPASVQTSAIHVSAAAPEHTDRVAVSTTGVTAGHGGAEAFVLQTPDHLGDASVLLGTIAGYDAAGGDRLITAGGAQVAVLATLEPLRTMSMMAHVSRPVPMEAHTDTKLVVDLNGDGVADGFVLLTSGADVAAGSGAHVASLNENNALMLAGQTLDHYLS